MFAWSIVPILLVALQTSPVEEQVRALAIKIAETMTARDPTVLNGAIDVPAFTDMVMKDVDVSEPFKIGFKRGLQPEIAKLGSQFLASMAEDASYHLLRVYAGEGCTHAIFRLLSEGKVNYHDAEFGRAADGSLKIRDMFIYVSGENLSQTAHRGYATAAAEFDRGVIERLLGAEQEYLKNLPKLIEMAKQVRAGQNSQAMKTFEAMPVGFRAQKVVQVLRLQAASDGEEKAYLEVITEFEKLFPGDASLDLVSIDGFYMRKKWDELSKTFDRLDRRVGGDAWIDYLRASAFIEQKKEDEARAALRAAIRREPTLADPHWTLIGLSLKSKCFDELAELLLAAEKALGLDLGGVETEESYAEFRASNAYSKWKAAREQK